MPPIPEPSEGLHANPGGNLDPAEILGRASLVESIWRDLDRQSVALTAERRMGKTSVLTLFRSNPPEGTVVLYQDLEGISSPTRFIENTLNALLPELGTGRRVREKLRDAYRVVGGMEVSQITLPELQPRDWRRLLVEVFETLDEDGRQFLFLWDELPLMVETIRDRHGAPEAIDLLDLLRQTRQTRRSVRMVLTGSIGLHHVLAKLRADGGTNDPVNDIAVVIVEPLDHADAADLARRLFVGEALDVPDARASADFLATAVDCIPFYIHHVVRTLRNRGNEPVSTALIAQIIQSALTSPQDPWNLRYYDNRLDSDYGERAATARTILDTIALAPASSLRDITNALASQEDRVSDEDARRVLALLAADHYIVTDPHGRWTFSYSILRRAWQVQRSLE